MLLITLRSTWACPVHRSSLFRYLIALLATAMAIVLCLFLNPLSGSYELLYITLFAALVLASWYSGVGPALLSFAIGAIGAFYFILPRLSMWAFEDLSATAGVIIYLILGAACVTLGHSLHRSQRRDEATPQLALERQEKLKATLDEHKQVEQQLERSEEALRRQNELTQTILENSTACLVMMDAHGYCTYMNRAGEQMFGWTFDEICQKPLHDMIHHHHPDGRPYPMSECPIDRALPENFDIREHEDVFIRRNGGFFPVLVAASPIFDRQGKPVSTVIEVRDVTASKQAEAALLKLAETLEERVVERTAALVESESQVRRMASMLAMAEQEERRRISRILHDDLQQQLYGIQMKLFFARRDGESGNEPAMLNGVVEAEPLIRQAIEVTRQLTVDLSPPILKNEGLADMLRWLVSQMKEMHGLEVALVAEHAFLIPDEDMRVLLFQIVRELLFNVVKHANTEHAMVELADAENGLTICVYDKGDGFDVANASQRDRNGGFGLFSVRERLGLFGGQIEIESAVSEGTRVIVHIPLPATGAL
jgi:PAS domain S-box-containing protein